MSHDSKPYSSQKIYNIPTILLLAYFNFCCFQADITLPAAAGLSEQQLGVIFGLSTPCYPHDQRGVYS